MKSVEIIQNDELEESLSKELMYSVWNFHEHKLTSTKKWFEMQQFKLSEFEKCIFTLWIFYLYQCFLYDNHKQTILSKVPCSTKKIYVRTSWMKLFQTHPYYCRITVNYCLINYQTLSRLIPQYVDSC